METEYNPYTCGESINVHGTFICKIETIPCALHTGEVCYKQKEQEFIERMARILTKGEDKE